MREKPYAANEPEFPRIHLPDFPNPRHCRAFDGMLAHPFAGARTGPEDIFIGGGREQRPRQAAQNNDEQALLDILGPVESSRFVGDETEDAQSRANFVQKYQEMHRLVKEPDGTTTLYIGAENWPTPIPLVNKGNSWYFDTDAAEKEILFRRIGRNEISTIRVCQELAAAEKEYYATHHNEYAQKIFSDQGQRNGLYWKAANGEPHSRSGRSWQQPMLKAMAEAETTHRLLTAATFTTS